MAQTSEIAEYTADKNIELITSAKEPVKRLGISVFNFNLPISMSQVNSKSCNKIIEENSLVLNGVLTPVSFVTEKNYVYEKKDFTRTEEMIEKALQVKEALYETFHMQGAVIPGRTVYEEEEQGKITRKNAYSCIEDIAETVPVIFEQ